MDSSSSVAVTPSLLYLIIYNLAQTIGWTLLTVNWTAEWWGSGSYAQLYDKSNVLLKIFQTLALLEIVHAAVGLVKSSAALTGMQIFSRVLVVWGILHTVPEVQGGIGVPMLLTAWCITEIMRYFYYVCALVKKIPQLLQWCRYTFFIVLYPLGVSGELLSIYGSLPYVLNKKIHTIELPNAANMSFSYYVVLIMIMLSYIPLFPQLYLHMFSQRRKMNAVHAKQQ